MLLRKVSLALSPRWRSRLRSATAWDCCSNAHLVTTVWNRDTTAHVYFQNAVPFSQGAASCFKGSYKMLAIKVMLLHIH